MKILKTIAENDEQLVQLFKNERARDNAFKQIVEKYQERLYWHIRKIVISHDDANDVLQNTLLKSWKGLLNFKGDSQLFEASASSLSGLRLRKTIILSLNPIFNAVYLKSKNNDLV